jgi:probable HAF family extracellular repeat protein
MRTGALPAIVTAAVLVGVGAMSGAAGTQRSTLPRWTLTEIGTLGGKYRDSSEATAINERGEIIASSCDAGDVYCQGFVWRHGVRERLSALPGPWGYTSNAYAISDRGDIVGASYDDSNDPRAVVWKNGSITALRRLRGAFASEALVVNAHGEIAGTSDDAARTGDHVVIWRDGMVVDLGAPPPPSQGSDQYPLVNAINDHGQVVGSNQGVSGTPGQIVGLRAFATRHGKLVPLTPAGHKSEAEDINDRGWIVGSVWTTRGLEHAALWRDGKVRDLGTLPPKAQSWAVAINDEGDVTGISGVKGGTEHAFV